MRNRAADLEEKVAEQHQGLSPYGLVKAMSEEEHVCSMRISVQTLKGVTLAKNNFWTTGGFQEFPVGHSKAFLSQRKASRYDSSPHCDDHHIVLSHCSVTHRKSSFYPDK